MQKNTHSACSFWDCHRKIFHKCLSCDRNFCIYHEAKDTSWGNFWIGDSLLQIPFKEWVCLICQDCARKDHTLSWLEFVCDFPFFIKFLRERSDLVKCWSIFKQTHDLGPESGHFEKNRWAKLYFPIKDGFEELEQNLEDTFSFSTLPFTSVFFSQRHYL